jgi:hypothetical protein
MMPAFEVCPTVCNANLAVNILANFTLTDNTVQLDTTCNGLVFITDDPGLNILGTAGSGAWLTTAMRTRYVATLAEVAAHYDPRSETYKAARDYFANLGQRGIVGQFLLAFWNEGVETLTVALDALNACNPCWTHVAMVHRKKDMLTSLLDTATSVVLAGWAQANEKIAYIASSDALHLTNGANDIAAQIKTAGYTDAFVVYTGIGQCAQKIDAAGLPLFFAAGVAVTDVDGVAVIDPVTGVQALSDGSTPQTERYIPYTEFLTAGWIASVDLSQADSGYDIANKPQGGRGWVGVLPTILSVGGLIATTGRNISGDINPAANGHANVFLSNQNQLGMHYGLTAGGLWIDQVHLRIYLRRRVADVITTLFANSRRLPYDDARGRQLLANAVATVMTELQGTGHFTGDAVRWEDFGEYVRKGVGWVIRQESFASQPQARKHARIAPALQVCYVPAGAANFIPITLCTLAVPTAA